MDSNKNIVDEVGKKVELIPMNPIGSANWSGQRQSIDHVVKSPTGYYKKLADKGIINALGDPSEWDNLGRASQGFWASLGNTVGGFVVNASAGFLENLGANDISDIANLSVNNTSKRYDNIFHQWANELRDWGEGKFHIFQSDDSIFHPKYWLGQIQQSGFTAGIIAEMLTEQFALIAASNFTGGAAGAAGLAGSYNKAKNLVRLRNTIRTLGAESVFGSYQGIKEAYINALDTGEQEYNTLKEYGFSEAEARKKASEASARGFRMEVLPLMTLNALQFAAIGKYNPFGKREGLDLGVSGGLSNPLGKLTEGIKNPTTKAWVDIVGVQGISEAGEEVFQEAVSKKAQYDTELRLGITAPKSFKELMFSDNDARDSGIGGWLGGIIFAGMGKIANKRKNKANEKEKAQEHDIFLNTVKSKVSDTIESIRRIDEEGGTTIAKAYARSSANIDNTFNALRLDLINGKESGFESYVSSMRDALKAANEGDMEALKNFGATTPEDIQNIKNNYEKYIADAVKFKDYFLEEAKPNTDPSFSLRVALVRTQLDINREIRGDIQEQIDQIKDSSNYNNLTETGKRIFDLETELSALKSESFASTMLQAEINAKEQGYSLNFENESEKTLNRISEIEKELGEIPKDYEGNKEDTVLRRLISKDDLVDNTVDTKVLDAFMDVQSRQVDYWRNSVNQEKFIKKTARARKEEAKTSTGKKKSKNWFVRAFSRNKEKKKASEEVDAAVEKEEVKEIIPPPGAGTTPDPDIPDKPKSKKEELKNQDTESHGPGKIVGKKNDEETDENTIKGDNPQGRGGTKNSGAEYNEDFLNTFRELYNSIPVPIKNGAPSSLSFRDFIDFILGEKNEKDKAWVKNNWDNLVRAWKESIDENINPTKVFGEVFKEDTRTPKDPIPEGQDSNGTEESKEETNKIEDGISEEDGTIIGFDGNGVPIISSDGLKTTDPSPKAGFLSIEYIRTTEVDEQGNIKDSIEDANDELYEGSVINSKKLLRSDSVNPGDELSLKVPTDVDNIPVSTWEDATTRGPNITWGEWKRQARERGLDETSREWIDKIPIVAVDKSGEAVFFVRDTDWYNPLNVGLEDTPAEQAKLIAEARRQLREVRNSFSSNQNSGTITINSKKTGTFVRMQEGETKTLNENNPQTILAVADDNGELRINGKDTLSSLGYTLINKKGYSFTNGYVYELRKGLNKGEYMAFPVTERGNLDVEEVDTIMEVIISYFDSMNSGTYTGENKNVYQRIRDNLVNDSEIGTDLSDVSDVEDFLSGFVRLVRDSSLNGARVDQVAKIIYNSSRYKDGSPFIVFQNGGIVFGIKGRELVSFSDGNVSSKPALYIPRSTIEKGKMSPSSFHSIMSELRNVLLMSPRNTSISALKNNKKVVKISRVTGTNPSSDGIISKGGKYRENRKNKFKTNVKSFNVGTKEKPHYATIVQPSITYSINDTEDNSVPGEEITNPVSENNKIKEKKAGIDDIERRRQEELKTAKIEIPRYFTFKELGGSKGKSGKALSSVESDKNEEIQREFESKLEEGDKLIEPNGDIYFFKNNTVVKPNGRPRGMAAIGAFINGVTIDRTDKINAKYDAELAELESQQSSRQDQDERISPVPVSPIPSEVLEAMGLNSIVNVENIEYLDDETNMPCIPMQGSPILAAEGLSTPKFTVGGSWEIVHDLGAPKFKSGGQWKLIE